MVVITILPQCEYATLPSILNMLNNRFFELPKIKTCLDFDDLWSDMVALYKGQKFSANTQVKITINGSPAIDAGGVRRHMYTKVFKDFADNRVISCSKEKITICDRSLPQKLGLWAC